MRLAAFLHRRLFARALRISLDRMPDVVIGGADNPYLLRWYLTPWSRFGRTERPANWRQALLRRLPNIYFHRFLRSDDDRALHDHPWSSISIIMMGGYIEHSIAAGGVNRKAFRNTRDIVFRRAKAAHRIELLSDDPMQVPKGAFRIVNHPVYILFLTGPRLREWGFHCPAGWRHWEDFVAPDDNGAVGRGCE